MADGGYTTLMAINIRGAIIQQEVSLHTNILSNVSNKIYNITKDTWKLRNLLNQEANFSKRVFNYSNNAVKYV